VTILLTERFQREVRALAEVERARCLELVLSLPRSAGDPHAHSGMALRKIHASGIWEARLGLGLRLVFTMRKSEVVLVTVGSHDDVRRFLRSI